MLTQPTHPAETSPRSRTPDGDRALARALIAALEIWLLALLAPLLGARAARAWVASILPATYEEDPSESTEQEIRLLIPFLFLIGAGPNRGARCHARTAPFVLTRNARGPPRPQPVPRAHPIRRASTVRRSDDSCPKESSFF